MKIHFNPDTSILTMVLGNGSSMVQSAHPQTNEPVTESNYLAVARACVGPDDWNSYLKLTGVEFEGVMCSATSTDQSGLIAVLTAYQLSPQKFKPTRFEFENGNFLVITASNIHDFIATWMPFRQQFFSV
jgi:hypothetical protein